MNCGYIIFIIITYPSIKESKSIFCLFFCVITIKDSSYSFFNIIHLKNNEIQHQILHYKHHIQILV